MTRAIVSGLTAHAAPAGVLPPPVEISIVQPSNPKRDQLCADFGEAGVRVVEDTSALHRAATVVVWAVKPQVLKAVVEANRGYFGPDALHVSIAAGVGTAALMAWTGNARVVRTMPNTRNGWQRGHRPVCHARRERRGSRPSASLIPADWPVPLGRF